MEILTLDTPSLGDRTTVVITDGQAVVIDPQRDLDRLLVLLDTRGVRVAHVLETHIHNDYVTGGYQLARLTGARYHLPAGEQAHFLHESLADGDRLEVGEVTIRAVHTPGHTPTHLAYVVERGGRPLAVATGGSLLYGAVGRTDLISAELTEELTRAQFRSVRALAEALPDSVVVLPTHGFGSFCSSVSPPDEDVAGTPAGPRAAAATDRTAEQLPVPVSGSPTYSTLSAELGHNPALTTDDEDTFVTATLAGYDAYPAYYAHMAPINLSGPGPVDLSPPEPIEDPAALQRRIHAGEWVVDLRPRRRFAAAHLRGTINIERADSTSTYIGWLMPWGTPVTLIADDPSDIAEVQRQLVRIGIDRPAAAGSTDRLAEAGAAVASYRVVDAAEFAAARRADPELVVLDVRRRLEWASAHLPGALHIPIHELEQRLHEVPTDREVWVHCASGFRAAIAASLLERAGRRPVLVAADFADIAAAAGATARAPAAP